MVNSNIYAARATLRAADRLADAFAMLLNAMSWVTSAHSRSAGSSTAGLELRLPEAAQVIGSYGFRAWTPLDDARDKTTLVWTLLPGAAILVLYVVMLATTVSSANSKVILISAHAGLALMAPWPGVS